MAREKIVKQCHGCRKEGPDVRLDPLTRKLLCNDCWVQVDPTAYGVPRPPRERPG